LETGGNNTRVGALRAHIPKTAQAVFQGSEVAGVSRGGGIITCWDTAAVRCRALVLHINTPSDSVAAVVSARVVVIAVNRYVEATSGHIAVVDGAGIAIVTQHGHKDAAASVQVA
jgi:hypothetical protein